MSFATLVENEQVERLMDEVRPYEFVCVQYTHSMEPFQVCEHAAAGETRDGYPVSNEFEGVVVDREVLLADLGQYFGPDREVESELFAVGCLGDTPGNCDRGLALLYFIFNADNRTPTEASVLVLELDYRQAGGDPGPYLSVNGGSASGKFPQIVEPWAAGKPIEPNESKVYIGSPYANSDLQPERFDAFYRVEP